MHPIQTSFISLHTELLLPFILFSIHSLNSCLALLWECVNKCIDVLNTLCSRTCSLKVFRESLHSKDKRLVTTMVTMSMMKTTMPMPMPMPISTVTAMTSIASVISVSESEVMTFTETSRVWKGRSSTKYSHKKHQKYL